MTKRRGPKTTRSKALEAFAMIAMAGGAKMDRTDWLVVVGILVLDVVVGATAIALRPDLVVAMINLLGAMTFMILAGINLGKIGRRS